MTQKDARKFSCPDCGARIVIRFLNPGDVALCRSCGQRVTVPENLIELPTTFDRSQAEPQPDNRTKSEPKLRNPWNPKYFILLGFFFSLAGVGIQWLLNFKRLGRERPPYSAGWIYTLAMIGLGVTIYFSITESLPFYAWQAFNLPVVIYFAISQKSAFEQYQERNAKTASFVAPVIIYFVMAMIVAGIAAVAALVGFVKGFENKSDSERQIMFVDLAMLSNPPQQVRRIFQSQFDPQRGHAMPNFMVGYCFYRESNFDSAASYIRLYLKKNPDERAAQRVYYECLVRTDLQHGDAAQARSALTQLISLNPDSRHMRAFIDTMKVVLDSSGERSGP